MKANKERIKRMEKVQLLPREVLNYLDDDFETLDLNLYKPSKYPEDKPLPAVISVPEDAEDSGGYTVLLSLQPDFGAAKTYKLKPGQRSIRVYNLFSGKIYYCRIISHSAQKAKVYDRMFETVPEVPRFIYVDGINNVRDAGGWRNTEGQMFRQGLLYRGSEMNLIGNHEIELTPIGRKTMLEELYIKTDLDLRNNEESGGLIQSPLGKAVNYVNEPLLGYMDIFKEEFKIRLHNIFQLLTKFESYPVYIHCWAGADRTGTVIALLKGALGFSYETITRDFELSTFSKFGVRGRCNKNFTYIEIFEHLVNHYPGGSLKECVRAFLFQEVDITDRDLQAIEDILFEE